MDFDWCSLDPEMPPVMKVKIELPAQIPVLPEIQQTPPSVQITAPEQPQPTSQTPPPSANNAMTSPRGRSWGRPHQPYQPHLSRKAREREEGRPNDPFLMPPEHDLESPFPPDLNSVERQAEASTFEWGGSFNEKQIQAFNDENLKRDEQQPAGGFRGGFNASPMQRQISWSGGSNSAPVVSATPAPAAGTLANSNSAFDWGEVDQDPAAAPRPKTDSTDFKWGRDSAAPIAEAAAAPVSQPQSRRIDTPVSKSVEPINNATASNNCSVPDPDRFSSRPYGDQQQSPRRGDEPLPASGGLDWSSPAPKAQVPPPATEPEPTPSNFDWGSGNAYLEDMKRRREYLHRVEQSALSMHRRESTQSLRIDPPASKSVEPVNNTTTSNNWSAPAGTRYSNRPYDDQQRQPPRRGFEPLPASGGLDWSSPAPKAQVPPPATEPEPTPSNFDWGSGNAYLEDMKSRRESTQSLRIDPPASKSVEPVNNTTTSNNWSAPACTRYSNRPYDDQQRQPPRRGFEPLPASGGLDWPSPAPKAQVPPPATEPEPTPSNFDWGSGNAYLEDMKSRRESTQSLRIDPPASKSVEPVNNTTTSNNWSAPAGTRYSNRPYDDQQRQSPRRDFEPLPASGGLDWSSPAPKAQLPPPATEPEPTPSNFDWGSGNAYLEDMKSRRESTQSLRIDPPASKSVEPVNNTTTSNNWSAPAGTRYSNRPYDDQQRQPPRDFEPLPASGGLDWSSPAPKAQVPPPATEPEPTPSNFDWGSGNAYLEDMKSRRESTQSLRIDPPASKSVEPVNNTTTSNNWSAPAGTRYSNRPYDDQQRQPPRDFEPLPASGGLDWSSPAPKAQVPPPATEPEPTPSNFDWGSGNAYLEDMKRRREYLHRVEQSALSMHRRESTQSLRIDPPASKSVEPVNNTTTSNNWSAPAGTRYSNRPYDDQQRQSPRRDFEPLPASGGLDWSSPAPKAQLLPPATEPEPTPSNFDRGSGNAYLEDMKRRRESTQSLRIDPPASKSVEPVNNTTTSNNWSAPAGTRYSNRPYDDQQRQPPRRDFEPLPASGVLDWSSPAPKAQVPPPATEPEPTPSNFDWGSGNAYLEDMKRRRESTQSLRIDPPASKSVEPVNNTTTSNNWSAPAGTRYSNRPYDDQQRQPPRRDFEPLPASGVLDWSSPAPKAQVPPPATEPEPTPSNFDWGSGNAYLEDMKRRRESTQSLRIDPPASKSVEPVNNTTTSNNWSAPAGTRYSNRPYEDQQRQPPRRGFEPLPASGGLDWSSPAPKAQVPRTRDADSLDYSEVDWSVAND